MIDPDLVGLAEARRRVLGIWSTGTQVHQLGNKLIVTGIRPARVRVCIAPGAPIAELHGVLTALPLELDEIEALALTPGAIVMAIEGRAHVVALAALPVVDVLQWLDLGVFEIVFGEPLAQAAKRAAIPPPPPTDVRVLTGMPPARAEVDEVTKALIRAQNRARASVVVPSPLGRLVRWLGTRFRARGVRPSSPSKALARETWFDRLRARLAAALWNSRLGAALGRKHAAYLRRVLELFDRGDLEEALRRAIPLGGEGDAARLGLGVPRPRQSLQLSLSARRSGSVIPVADLAMSMMRDRYRAAATRLEQAGRIDEAAFVLADLLGDIHAAIALLERHGKFDLAAQLAEAREIEPGLIVRLWFLAGDRGRAIDTARRTRAWGDAVARLERAKDPRAAVLRMLWADHLADSGDFVQAVEVAWPVPQSRALVEAWIDRGMVGDGSAAARLLVKKLIVAPTAFDRITPTILGVLEHQGFEAIRSRLALIDELVAAPTSAELRTIARPALRAMVRDCANGAEGTNSDTLKKLVRFADDGGLRADQPTIAAAPQKASLLERVPPLQHRWFAGDAGALPIFDAALLPDGRMLVALGELGVRIIGRTGSVQAHIEQPAIQLVVSDHGARALAVAPRGQVRRIARLDLIDRRGAHWCDAELDGAVSTFDGDLWIATRRQQVFAIDTTGPRWRAIWGVEVDQPSCSVRREGPRFAIEAIREDGGELWFYEGFTLRRRHQWKPMEALWVGGLPGAQQWFALTKQGLRGENWLIGLDDLQPIAIDVHGARIAVGQRRPEGIVVTLCQHEAARSIATLLFDGAQRVALRLTDALLTAADDRGRAVVLELQHGTILRDLRIS